MAVLAALSGSLLLATAPAATAHNFQLIIPGRLGTGSILNYHTHVTACDTSGDNHGVIVFYTLRDGQRGSVYDGNGANNSCVARTVTSTRNPIVKFQPCTLRAGRIGTCSWEWAP